MAAPLIQEVAHSNVIDLVVGGGAVGMEAVQVKRPGAQSNTGTTQPFRYKLQCIAIKTFHHPHSQQFLAAPGHQIPLG